MTAGAEDWARARADFTAGAGVRELARRLGVAPSTVTRRARAEGWTAGATPHATPGLVPDTTDAPPPAQHRARACTTENGARAAPVAAEPLTAEKPPSVGPQEPPKRPAGHGSAAGSAAAARCELCGGLLLARAGDRLPSRRPEARSCCRSAMALEEARAGVGRRLPTAGLLTKQF